MASVTTSESAPKRGQYFVGLDLVRGLAALAVYIYHIDFAFGLRGQLLPGGYTAVDLFFIISGFVIATTYEEAIVARTIDFADFARRRVARLYPLYLLTLLVGLVVMSGRFYSNYKYFDEKALTVSAAFNALMLPTPLSPYDGHSLFPFNAASWSIFYEVAITIVFFFVFARMRIRALVACWLLSAGLLGVAVAHFGTIDLGWGAKNFLAAFPRISFSFLTGLLVWRAFKVRPWSAPPALFYALVLGYFVFLQARILEPAALVPWIDFLAVALFLPAIIIAGAGVFMGREMKWVSGRLGDVSYAVYLTQDACVIFLAGLFQIVLKTKIYAFAPWIGFVLVAIILVEGYLCFHYFEVPMRRWLRAPARIPVDREASYSRPAARDVEGERIAAIRSQS